MRSSTPGKPQKSLSAKQQQYVDANVEVVRFLENYVDQLKAELINIDKAVKGKDPGNVKILISFLSSKIDNNRKTFSETSKLDTFDPVSFMYAFYDDLVNINKAVEANKRQYAKVAKQLAGLLEDCGKHLTVKNVTGEGLSADLTYQAAGDFAIKIDKSKQAIEMIKQAASQAPAEDVEAVIEVKEDPEAKREAQEVKLSNVLAETLLKETTFLDDVGTKSAPVYVEVAKKLPATAQAMTVLQENIANTRTTSAEFSSMLQRVIGESKLDNTALSVFADHLRNVLILAVNSTELKQDVGSDEKPTPFGEAMKKAIKHAGQKADHDPLIFAVQRLPRYELLAKEMLNNTDNNDPRHNVMKNMLLEAKKYNEYLNVAVALISLLHNNKEKFRDYNLLKEQIIEGIPNIDKIESLAMQIAVKIDLQAGENKGNIVSVKKTISDNIAKKKDANETVGALSKGKEEASGNDAVLAPVKSASTGDRPTTEPLKSPKVDVLIDVTKITSLVSEIKQTLLAYYNKKYASNKHEVGMLIAILKSKYPVRINLNKLHGDMEALRQKAIKSPGHKVKTTLFRATPSEYVTVLSGAIEKIEQSGLLKPAAGAGPDHPEPEAKKLRK